ncbi:MAG TPA: CoA ester lyase [Stellaceae bacterium]|nr:CoA ester lyase [Stellaceae bacterium]
MRTPRLRQGGTGCTMAAMAKQPTSRPTRRPPALRRCWLVLPGAERAALLAAPATGADVLMQELEDFTPPERRPEARALAAEIYAAWRQAGALVAVRVNPLETVGREDLAAVMRGRPDIVLMSKVAEPAQVAALAEAVQSLEYELGIPAGETELVPNIESARGVVQALAIATASRRVTGVMGSTEDLAADLGAPRSRDGRELAYARQRLHLDCVAAGVLSVDCPYTFADAEGCAADARYARSLGYVAKSAVHPSHVALVNAVMTPSAQEVTQARAVIAAFEAARKRGEDRVEVAGLMVEMPTYLSAQRLLARAAALGVA